MVQRAVKLDMMQLHAFLTANSFERLHLLQQQLFKVLRVDHNVCSSEILFVTWPWMGANVHTISFGQPHAPTHRCEAASMTPASNVRGRDVRHEQLRAGERL